MLSPDKAKPRPLKFTNMAQFVYGGPQTTYFPAAFDSHYPINEEKAHPKNSLFDRYNHNNLTLLECNKADVQVLTKNILMAEGQLSSKMIDEIISKSSKNIDRKAMTTGFAGFGNKNVDTSKKGLASTGFNFKDQKQSKQLMSKEYKENEALFNYQKIALEKKAKKQAFLSQIQQRIAMIEQQAQQIEEAQLQQKLQIGEINLIQGRIKEQLAMNSYVGKINQMVQGNIEQQQVDSPRKNLNIYMGKSEVNDILDDHFQMNENLIEEVNRVSRSREFAKSSDGFKEAKSSKSKEKTSMGKTSFKQTMKKGISDRNIPAKPDKKVLMNTMKCPPKSIKGKF